MFRKMADKRSFMGLGVAILVLTIFVTTSHGVRVTFCSGQDLSGSCATKNVEIGLFRSKCEDFPFRFRWFLTARSVRVEGNFLGGCGAVCRLHNSDRCRCWFGDCPKLDFGCRHINLMEGHGWEGVSCA